MKRISLLSLCLLLMGGTALSFFVPNSWQAPWNRTGRQRSLPSRDSFPTWETNPQFAQDVFTFVRIQFDSQGPFGWHDRWDNDFPDGDWNFSLRLQQLTTMTVDPDSKFLRLDDPSLLEYPFVYFAGVQYMRLSPDEQAGFRRYLLNGGFFMMDDLWGVESRENVMREMLAVLPNCTPVELPLSHEVFHVVYDLQELPQVTDYLTWSRGSRFEYSHEGEAGDVAPHFIAYFDDFGRMVGIVCHNNDIGDGWEREGHHQDYFMEYSVKHSYPFGINVITYAMTH
ncbi:MAG: DUF4159 domain-containing protein [Pirellulaceae bacterium]